ncbi:MAG: phosphatase PAP2 family protein [Bernardetiaceae bacterium]|nr:phosphatase PAP2 family protein [Bernardetiaceae bacterium]
MIEKIIAYDQSFFIWLNSFNHEGIDPIMHFITSRNGWIPMYILTLIFLVAYFRKKSFLLFPAIALTIALCDNIASRFAKPFFERLRPCHEASLSDMIHTVGKCGGEYGFFSSHAANTFGIAMLLYLLLRRCVYRWIGITYLAWATLVSYSRIYVGVHYPLDIFFGGITGVFIGFLMYKILAIKQLYSYSPVNQ